MKICPLIRLKLLVSQISYGAYDIAHTLGVEVWNNRGDYTNKILAFFFRGIYAGFPRVRNLYINYKRLFIHDQKNIQNIFDMRIPQNRFSSLSSLVFLLNGKKVEDFVTIRKIEIVILFKSTIL